MSTYGFYAKRHEIARSDNVDAGLITQLTQGLMKIGKGGLLVKLLGVYRGFCSHQRLDAGGNCFAQFVAAKNGIRRGGEGYMIARCENTIIKGIIVTFATRILRRGIVGATAPHPEGSVLALEVDTIIAAAANDAPIVESSLPGDPPGANLMVLS